jgi:hypothetical protein
LDNAGNTLSAALRRATSGDSPYGAAPGDVPPELWAQLHSLAASIALVSASRYATVLASNVIDANATFEKTVLPLHGGVSRVPLTTIEDELLNKYLLPAARSAKVSKSTQLEANIIDLLADVRRVFAGVDPIAVPGMKPIAVSVGAAAAISRRAKAARIDGATVAAITYRTAQAMHGLLSPLGPAFAVNGLLAADHFLLVLKLAAAAEATESNFERRVQAVERCIGCLHDLKPWLASHIDSQPTIRTTFGAAEAAPLLAARLCAVLLEVLRMQQEQHGKAAPDGGVKALYALALKATAAAPGAGLDAARQLYAVLEQLVLVFRSFQAKRKTRK